MKLMSIQEYIDKREKLQIEEAKHLALEYIKRFGKKPPIDIFFEYFVLFMPIDDAAVNDKFLAQINVGGTADETVAFYHHYKRPFETFEQFMEYCTK